MEQVAYPREIFHCVLEGFFVSFGSKPVCLSIFTSNWSRFVCVHINICGNIGVCLSVHVFTHTYRCISKFRNTEWTVQNPRTYRKVTACWDGFNFAEVTRRGCEKHKQGGRLLTGILENTVSGFWAFAWMFWQRLAPWSVKKVSCRRE